MAGIGLYGVYYSKATVADGILTGYSGVQTMGKAIAASFAPVESNENRLYANNGIAETDAQAAAGGTLNLTLDALKQAAMADIFGLTSKTAGSGDNAGTGFDFTGEEQANAVGVAFIRQKQESQNRNIHEAVIYSYVTFSAPNEEYQTLGESVEWQTPKIEGTVSGGAVTGTRPWKKVYTFTSQAAAVAFITEYFAAATSNTEG